MEHSPHILVSLFALGMGLAFVSADRTSRTSRALGAAMGFIGIAIYLNVSVTPNPVLHPWLSGLTALPEAISAIVILEWLLRVRRTVPPLREMNVAFGDRVLRVGQASGVAYALLALIWPEIRAEDFIRAGANPRFFDKPGFWLFATPILFACFTGLIGVILLLNRRPERAETVRVLGMAASIPFMVAGFVLPLNAASVSLVIGEIIFMIGAVHYHVMQGQRGQFMSRFLSPQVATLVSERGLGRAMQENSVEITVVCCDLRGFTAYAQAHSSQHVLQVLRAYYDAVGRIVADFGATIKDFAGDGILVLVGAPLPIEHHARCGIEMARRIRIVGVELTRRWSTPTHTLGIGLGVATGLVTVGVIGSASRLEYTAVGSAVNLASRLCEHAESSEILVDARTVALAGEAGLEPCAPIPIKGFGEAVPHYSLTAI